MGRICCISSGGVRCANRTAKLLKLPNPAVTLRAGGEVPVAVLVADDSDVPPPAPVQRLHLYPQLCTATTTTLCSSCDSALSSGRVPAPSIAGGWDLGSPELAQPPLPELSFAEKLCIARTRVLSTALNIRVPRSVQCRDSLPCPTMIAACS